MEVIEYEVITKDTERIEEDAFVKLLRNTERAVYVCQKKGHHSVLITIDVYSKSVYDYMYIGHAGFITDCYYKFEDFIAAYPVTEYTYTKCDSLPDGLRVLAHIIEKDD